MVGELFFNEKDAFTNWGIVMGKGCFASLICPGSPKSYITNDARTAHGIDYVCGDGARIDERKFSMSLSIMASSRADLYNKIMSFSEDVLEGGLLDVSTKYQTSVQYHCVYEGFTQLTEFNGRLATFTLSLIEFDPTSRVPENLVTFYEQSGKAVFKYATDVTTEVNFIGADLETYQGGAVSKGLTTCDLSREYNDAVQEGMDELYDLEIIATGSKYTYKTKIEE